DRLAAIEFFMQPPGRVFTRGQLLDGVWGNEVYVDERTVDVRIGRLLLVRAWRADPFRAVRGAAYGLEARGVPLGQAPRAQRFSTGRKRQAATRNLRLHPSQRRYIGAAWSHPCWERIEEASQAGRRQEEIV